MIQKLKQKFKIIIPFWILALVLIISIQNSFYLLTLPKANISKEQILGAETAIRGNVEVGRQKSLVQKIKDPDFSNISAKSFIVFNLETGQVLAEKSADLKLPIASLTKLLTSLVSYEYLDLNHEILISNEDTNSTKPNLSLSKGDTVKAIDLFNSMIVGSSNDSAVALANFVSKTTGKKFTELMNSMAIKLSMNNSNFSNPLGFDSIYNYSTANDLKKLISATQNLAVYKNLGRRTSYEFLSSNGKKFAIKATNKLISTHQDIEAIKTGFTEGSKGSMATKIRINNVNFVFLVIGSEDREEDTLKLKDAISSNYLIK